MEKQQKEEFKLLHVLTIGIMYMTYHPGMIDCEYRDDFVTVNLSQVCHQLCTPYYVSCGKNHLVKLHCDDFDDRTQKTNTYYSNFVDKEI